MNRAKNKQLSFTTTTVLRSLTNLVEEFVAAQRGDARSFTVRMSCPSVSAMIGAWTELHDI